MRDARRKPLASLRATALRLLARREYPRAELEARLLARGAEREAVAQTLDALERRGYLSDARFAQMVVAQKAGAFGKRAIAHALRERRVEPAAAREALAALGSDDEPARAKAVWSKRFGAPPRDAREHGRQVRFLLARGFGLRVALAVVGRPLGRPEVDAAADDANDANEID